MFPHVLFGEKIILYGTNPSGQLPIKIIPYEVPSFSPQIDGYGPTSDPATLAVRHLPPRRITGRTRAT
jgi:hypothetical protein